jgi:hypothetical protein
MIRRAFGISFYLSSVRLARAGTSPKAPLERSPSVPPRVTSFRFDHAQCAAVMLERWPNKKCPHESRLRLGKAPHAGKVGFKSLLNQ